MSLRNFSNNLDSESTDPKPVESISQQISSLKLDSLSSTNPTLYDKWNIFRIIMTNPKDNKNLSIDLRKYRVKEDGRPEYCNEVVSYTISKDDPIVDNAISAIIEQAIKKGVELQYFK